MTTKSNPTYEGQPAVEIHERIELENLREAD